MIKTALSALLLMTAVAPPATAQETIKILTPDDDTCAPFVAAMNSGDTAKVLALGGWALGFISGVAQGTGADILRGATVQGVMNRLYAECQRQPGQAMSVALEEIARALVAGRH